MIYFFFFSSRRRHTRFSRDWSSDVCSSDLGGHPPVSDDAFEQRTGLPRGEYLKVETASAVAGDQAAEPVATGHHDDAVARTGQQWPYLVGAVGVVEHDEHATVGQQTAIQRGDLLGRRGYLLRRYAQCA